MTAWFASLRLAWRDLLAQGRRSAFFALLVAAGVASLVGVQGVARTLETAAHDSARQMMQGDLKVTLDASLTGDQQAAIAALESRGAEPTRVVQRVTYATAGSRMLLVETKAVDPAVWPYYGGLETLPDRPLADLLGEGSALVAPALLERLGVQVGDTVQIGNSPVRIAGVVVQEPQDYSSGQIPMGPRVLVALGALPETGGGSLEGTTLLWKLPPGLQAAEAKAALLQAFAENRVQTHTDSWKQFAELMNRVFGFLSLVALVSLLVGGLGVATAMRSFIQQKLEHIAVLKSLGATSAQIMWVFLTEAAILGLSGSLVGALLGLGVQQLLPVLLSDLIPLTGQRSLNLTAALSGLAVGTVIAIIFALLPVRAVREIRPNLIFHGNSQPAAPTGRALLESTLVLLLVLAGLGYLAVVQAGSATLGLGFLGAIVGAGILVALLSRLLLFLLRLLPQRGMPALRHALRSIRAPGSQAHSVVVAMGISILLMMVVYLLQVGLLQQVKAAEAQPDAANLLLLNVPKEERAPVRALLESHEAVRSVFEPTVMVTGSLAAVDGRPVAELTLPPWARAPMVMVSANDWFTTADIGLPFVALDQAAADDLGVQVGSTLRLQVKQGAVDFTVRAIYPAPDAGAGLGGKVLQTPAGTLDAYAEMYMLSASVRPEAVQQISAQIMERFPQLVPLSLVDLFDLINQTLAKVANVLRFITAFALLAAAVILSGSLSATRYRRRKEGALLKCLGASRFSVALASAVENGLLGGVAGLAGGGLGFGLVQALLVLGKVGLTLPPWPLLAAVLGGALLAVLAGFASTLDVLQVRPLQVLRGE
ncbi:MAG: ABC transporter permease [Bacillota bacterium]